MDTKEVLKKHPCKINIWSRTEYNDSIKTWDLPETSRDTIGRNTLPSEEWRPILQTSWGNKSCRITLLEEPKWNEDTKAEVTFLAPLEEQEEAEMFHWWSNIMEGTRQVGLALLTKEI